MKATHTLPMILVLVLTGAGLATAQTYTPASELVVLDSSAQLVGEVLFSGDYKRALVPVCLNGLPVLLGVEPDRIFATHTASLRFDQPDCHGDGYLAFFDSDSFFNPVALGPNDSLFVADLTGAPTAVVTASYWLQGTCVNSMVTIQEALPAQQTVNFHVRYTPPFTLETCAPPVVAGFAVPSAEIPALVTFALILATLGVIQLRKRKLA